MIRHCLALVIVFSYFLPQPDHAPISQPQFEDVAVFYQFGKQVTFQAKLSSTETISDISIIIQPDMQKTRIKNIPMKFNKGMIFAYNIEEQPFRPFSKINYHYEVSLINGKHLASQNYSFDYIDNRFDWQVIRNGQFQIYWQQGTKEFGQMVLNIAQNGLRSAQDYLSVIPRSPIRIFIYSTPQDIQTALKMSRVSWAAGQAVSDQSVVLVSTPPGFDQRLELERQIPHEIMHILIYQVAQDSYVKVPTWLSEGMASLAELYPNPDYQQVLEDGADSGKLISMKSLCNGFPTDTEKARLAYAQSASFVRYIYQKHGAPGLGDLLIQSSSGKDCEGIISSALPTTLNQLETQWWRDILKKDPGEIILENFSPFFFVLVIVVFSPILSLILIK